MNFAEKMKQRRAEMEALQKESTNITEVANAGSLSDKTERILTPFELLKLKLNKKASTDNLIAPIEAKSMGLPPLNATILNNGDIQNTPINPVLSRDSVEAPPPKPLTWRETLALRQANKITEAVTVAEVQAVVKEEIKTLTFAEKLALKREAQRIAEENVLVKDLKIDPEEPSNNDVVKTYPDAKISPNIAVAVKESLSERLARIKKEKEDKPAPLVPPVTEVKRMGNDAEYNASFSNKATFSLDIVLNDKQQSAVDFVSTNQPFVLLGAAGTGKTSSERGMLTALVNSGLLGTSSFKVSGDTRIDAPSVAVVAYTRRAASNSAKAILKDPMLATKLKMNIMTIHALLEFIPVEYFDQVLQKDVFRFEPQRTAANPLTLTHLFIEEATLLGLDLWEQLLDALPPTCVIVFIGDINQLPPVFGASILNYAITKLPVIELTQVYRQGEGSPIIDNAHRILRGEYIESATNDQGRLQVITGGKQLAIGQQQTAHRVAKLLQTMYEAGEYSPEEDMILSPYNKQPCGSDNMNNHIAEFLSSQRKPVVYHIIAGFRSLYLAEGDKVMFNKRDALIVDISPNPAYSGKEPELPGTDLSRFGVRRIGEGNQADLEDIGETSMEDLDVPDYSSMTTEEILNSSMKRTFHASHKVTIAYETGNTEVIQAAGDFNDGAFSLGYAMTVHKSQGSEWRKVFILFHPDQQRNLFRELLYTAITRARDECYLIAKQAVLDKSVNVQRVKGNTLADKIAYFNSGVEQNDAVYVTPSHKKGVPNAQPA